MVAGREQGLEQHVAVLVGGVGIPQLPPALQGVEAGSLPLAGEQARIQPHQHDHPMGNGAHGFEGADGEGPTAVAKPPRIGGEPLIQPRGHHGGGQRQGAIARGPLPVVDGGQHGGQLPVALAALTEQVRQQGLQAGAPLRRLAGPAQLAEPVAQAREQVQPAAHQLEAVAAGEGGCVGGGQPRLIGQHQAEQQPVAGPGQAALHPASPLAAV